MTTPENDRQSIRADKLPWEQPGCFRLDCEPHRGTPLYWMAVISAASNCIAVVGAAYDRITVGWLVLILVAIPLSLTTWQLAGRDLAQMRKGWMDPSGERLTRDAWESSILALAFALLVVLFILDR